MRDYVQSGALIEIDCQKGEEFVKAIKSINFEIAKDMGKKTALLWPNIKIEITIKKT